MSAYSKKWKGIILIACTAVSLPGCSFYPATEPAVLSMEDSEILSEESTWVYAEIPEEDESQNESINGEVSDGMILMGTGAGGNESEPDAWQDKKHYFGSAEFLAGNTAIVAIFSNDADVEWTDSASDEKMKKQMKKNIRIACDYLSGCVSPFGKEAVFYYDWDEYPELFYEASFDESMVEQEGLKYGLEKDFIETQVDTKGIKEHFEARNIIYMFFFNTEFENSVRPWTYSHAQGEYYDNETINIFVRFDHVVSPPATIAHEILHCFGAPDYYYANDQINQEFVDYCSENMNREIMYSVNTGDRINRSFSDLTAYYVGLTSSSNLVEEWNLGISERAQVILEMKQYLGLTE